MKRQLKITINLSDQEYDSLVEKAQKAEKTLEEYMQFLFSNLSKKLKNK